jgi:hypothetical protein
VSDTPPVNPSVQLARLAGESVLTTAPIAMRNVVGIPAGEYVYVRSDRYVRYREVDGFSKLTGYGFAAYLSVAP